MLIWKWKHHGSLIQVLQTTWPTIIHYLLIIFHALANSIKIADGSLSPIAGKGNIKISEILILKYVLYVQNIACNLFSINKLTKDMNCVAKFFNSHCEFQDLCSGKMIGSAKECDELYVVEKHLSSENNKLWYHKEMESYWTYFYDIIQSENHLFIAKWFGSQLSETNKLNPSKSGINIKDNTKIKSLNYLLYFRKR